MATRYKLKRKTFGALDAVRGAVGGTVETAGDIVDSGIGKTAGAIAGAAYAPKIFKGIGQLTSGTGSVMSTITGGGGAAASSAAANAASSAATQTAAQSAGGSLGKLAGVSPMGMLGGALLGWGAAKLAGKLLKKTGRSISGD